MAKEKTKLKVKKAGKKPKPEQIPEDTQEAPEKYEELSKLEQYLRFRADEREPGSVRVSKIIGFDIHIPLLALLEVVSIGLLLAVMFYNVNLNYDSELFKGLENDLRRNGWVGNIYVNSILILLMGMVIGWGYNLASYWPFKLFKREYLSANSRKVIFALIIFFLFFGIMIYILFTSIFLLSIFLLFILITAPVLFGAIGIIIKSRGAMIISLIFIIITALLHRNTAKQMLDLVLFAAVVFLYLEVSEATFKFKQVYSRLNPERDLHDYMVLSDTIANYLLVLAPMIGLAALFTYLIFYSQGVLKAVLPIEIVNSLEFNSAIYIILPLIILAILIALGKWLIMKIFVKPTSKQDKPSKRDFLS
ncbi:hypothetical protein [[Eubacterium] cellulosolvens]